MFLFNMFLLALFCLLAIGLYFGFLNRSINRKLAHEQQYITRLNTQIKSLESVIKKVEAFKKQKTDLEQKIKTIKKLDAQRTGPVFIMEEFSEIMPEKLWVTTFKEEGKSLSLEGFGADGPTIERFVDQLRESSYFNAVTLESVTQSTSPDEKKSTMEKFVIKTDVNYTPGNV